MRPRALLAALLFVALASPGCEEDVGTLPDNLTPLTYLSIVGADLDTTNYRKILHWWGTDADGEVRAYLIRWDGGWVPPTGTAQVYEGLTYSRTTATRDTFNVPLGGTFGRRTFAVRAIDDHNAVDPNGVLQEFPLTNSAPTLAWNPALPRPTRSLPAVAFGWNPADFDGRGTVTTFRIWLDGDSASAKTVVRDTIAALFPEDFGDRIDRERTVYVQALDDAHTVSNIVSHTWTVEKPRGDWLLIDQITGPGANTWDRPFFSAVLDSVTGGSLHTLDLASGSDFVTEKEIEPLFTLFRGVVWVTGPFDESNDGKMARNLRLAEEAISSYVRGGGEFLLAGQTTVGYGGGLGSDFAQEVLGISEYYEIVDPNDPRNRVTDLVLSADSYIRFERNGQPDSLKVYTTSTRVDYFPAPLLPGTGLYWVPPGALKLMSGRNPTPSQDADPAYLGVVADYGAGRICLITNSYARLFPRSTGYEGDWGEAIGEGVRLFREVLSR